MRGLFFFFIGMLIMFGVYQLSQLGSNEVTQESIKESNAENSIDKDDGIEN